MCRAHALWEPQTNCPSLRSILSDGGGTVLSLGSFLSDGGDTVSVLRKLPV